MRRKPRVPDYLRGVEVMPRLDPAQTKRLDEERELEFWRGIIPPITPEEFAAARTSRLAREVK